jgi:predicted tellurium resistance membrane protein TerC
MPWLSDPEIWLSLLTLSVLEIVLGIDNLVFLAILSDRLPPEQRALGRRLGLGLALVTRLLLLAGLAWSARLAEPVFVAWGHAVSWRDAVLIGGGLFLLTKAIHEIHGSLEGEEEDAEDGAEGDAHPARPAASLIGTVVQIGLLDIIFSLDSVITAVGMARDLWVMSAAVVLAVLVMMMAAGGLSRFIARHPTVKMLALSFLLLVGTTLVAEGTGLHVPKGYLYFAMGFALLVESLNLLLRRRRNPVRLRTPML